MLPMTWYAGHNDDWRGKQQTEKKVSSVLRRCHQWRAKERTTTNRLNMEKVQVWREVYKLALWPHLISVSAETKLKVWICNCQVERLRECPKNMDRLAAANAKTRRNYLGSYSFALCGKFQYVLISFVPFDTCEKFAALVILLLKKRCPFVSLSHGPTLAAGIFIGDEWYRLD